MSPLIKLTRTIHFLEQSIHVCTMYIYNYYSVDMFSLGMLGLGGVLKSVVLFPTPFYFVFENSNLISYTQKNFKQ